MADLVAEMIADDVLADSGHVVGRIVADLAATHHGVPEPDNYRHAERVVSGEFPCTCGEVVRITPRLTWTERFPALSAARAAHIAAVTARERDAIRDLITEAAHRGYDAGHDDAAGYTPPMRG